MAGTRQQSKKHINKEEIEARKAAARAATIKKKEREAMHAAALAAITSNVVEIESKSPNSEGRSTDRRSSAPIKIPGSPRTPSSPLTPQLTPGSGRYISKFAKFDTHIGVHLENPLLLVSVGATYHEGEALKSIISLIRKTSLNAQLGFNHLTVLVAGSLQRYNPWNFSVNLDNAKLEKLFSNVPAGLNCSGLATFIANAFYVEAKKAETAYRKTNSLLFNRYLPLSFDITFINWEEMVPVKNSHIYKSNQVSILKAAQATTVAEAEAAEKEIHTFGNYAEYYAKVANEYKSNPEFAQALIDTSDRILTSKKDLIEFEMLRIFNSNALLSHFVNEDIVKIARELCTKFLLEECPLLFAELVDKGYTSIIYPAGTTKAFEATLALFKPDKQIEWLNTHTDTVRERENWGLSTDLEPLSIPPPSIRRPTKLVTNRSFSGTVTTNGLSTSPEGPASEPIKIRHEGRRDHEFASARSKGSTPGSAVSAVNSEDGYDRSIYTTSGSESGSPSVSSKRASPSSNFLALPSSYALHQSVSAGDNPPQTTTSRFSLSTSPPESNLVKLSFLNFSGNMQPPQNDKLNDADKSATADNERLQVPNNKR